MAKADLGTKRQCPKCGTRFYDLGKDDPIACVSCGQKFEPEQILKPRNRPVPQVVAKPVKKAEPEPKASGDADLEALADDDDDDEEDADLGTVLEIDDDDDDDIGVKIDPDAVKDEPS